VLEVASRRRVVSRSDLARETGLAKASMSEVVDGLVADGLLRVIGEGPSNGGRPPLLYEFNPNARFAIGVELGDRGCSAVLANLDGVPIDSAVSEHHTSTAETAIAHAIELIDRLRSRVPAGALLGIGVGAPGQVDPALGVIESAPDLGWSGVPVGQRLADHARVRVAVINRAKAQALAEGLRGAGQTAGSFVCLTVSTGIAAGIVLDGRLLHDLAGSDGELGHMTIIPDGPLCACGNRGCLQALVSEQVVLGRVREDMRFGGSRVLFDLTGGRPDLVDLAVLEEALAREDPVTVRVLDEVGSYLGIAVANVVNLLSPDVVVLGGRLIRALPSLVDRVDETIRKRAVPRAARGLRVVASQLGWDAVPTGAAALVLGQVSEVGMVGQRRLKGPDTVVHPRSTALGRGDTPHGDVRPAATARRRR
jgi:predicted NBD/HSP70 family sugar kinase